MTLRRPVTSHPHIPENRMRAPKQLKGGKRTPKAPTNPIQSKQDEELLANVRALGGDEADFSLVKNGDDSEIQEFSHHEAHDVSMLLYSFVGRSLI